MVRWLLAIVCFLASVSAAAVPAKKKPLPKQAIKAIVQSAPSEKEAPPPVDSEPDRERIVRLQEALYNIVHGPVLGRLRVGIRVMDLASGRMLYGRAGTALMDPASNQKVLATAAALLRLGPAWRYRTELVGASPDADGVIAGDLLLRGSSDPSLRAEHLDDLAATLARQGVTRVHGGVLSDPRRLGADEVMAGVRSPLRVSRSAIEIRVRPGPRTGARPAVALRPDSDVFVLENRAVTRGRGRSRIKVALAVRASGKVQIVVSGRIPARHPGVVVRRVPPNQALYAAVLLRAALVQAGIEVWGPPGVGTGKRSAADARHTAWVRPPWDAPVALEPLRAEVLAVHESEPLPVLMRRINKDSDNEYAERLLETVGAEIYGGPATTAKGIRALREAISELGLPPNAYVSVNGSGLGHQNRITADAMADLLRKLFWDPRLGPDMLQSLSVGGIDGTIRNRFRGSPAAERVRAKTGTLRGKSCLSGYVGDGSDVLVFSIFVQGLRRGATNNVRHAQVSAVNAMMRYVRGAIGPAPGDETAPGIDYEAGDEILDTEAEEEFAVSESGDPVPAPPDRTD